MKVARGAARNDMSIVRKWENISHYAYTDGFESISGCVIKPLPPLSKDSIAYRSRVREYKWVYEGERLRASEWASKQTAIRLRLFFSFGTDARIMKLVWRTSGRFIQIKDRIERYIDAVGRYSIENQSRDCRIKIKWLAVTKLHLIKLTEINDIIS